jgi:hypothetical protein
MGEEKKSKILKPGDQEYQEALDSFTQEDLDLVRKGLEQGDLEVNIEWHRKDLREGTLEYAVIPLTATTSKVVFHFIKLSQKMMHEVSEFFQTKICGPIITVADIQSDVEVEAGLNPLWRSNWDVTILRVNKYRAPTMMHMIANLVAKEFPV